MIKLSLCQTLGSARTRPRKPSTFDHPRPPRTPRLQIRSTPADGTARATPGFPTCARPLTPSVLCLHCNHVHKAVAVETLYTMYKACALDRQPCTASDSAMLWVDLSKCFMTFSRAVGQLLEKSRGVPAQVRKAVWSLYSRPHRSFDWAFGWGAALAAYVAPCRRSNPQPGLALQLFRAIHTRTFRYFIFQCKGHPNDTTSRWYSHPVGYRVHDTSWNTSR